MEARIDKAVKAGTLTDDQATQMKKSLDAVKDELTQDTANGATLSRDERKKIGTELRDIGKQLSAALNLQASSTATPANGIDSLFAAMDTNGDGSIDKNELSAFLAGLGNGSGAPANKVYDENGDTSGASSSSFSVSA